MRFLSFEYKSIDINTIVVRLQLRTRLKINCIEAGDTAISRIAGIQQFLKILFEGPELDTTDDKVMDLGL